MPVIQLDTENADRDLTSQVTCLTHTPNAAKATICQGLIKFGDGVKDLDGTGGDFELTVTVGGQTIQPDPQTIAFSTAARSAAFTSLFPVPANAEVILKAKSPNAGDSSVDVTAYLYEVTGALPDAAPDAAGGLPISDAGGLDMDNDVKNQIIAYNLDHLCKTATAAADMTTEVADNTILSRMLANGDTSAFDPSTDGLQLIRDKLPTNLEDLSVTDTTGYVALADTQKVDLNTIKTKAVTCAAAVTVLAQVGAAGAPGEANGVLIAGSNEATTFAGITSTGGITVTQATGNAPGLSLTGNGTGPGALITGGNGSGTGLAVMGGVLNGIGIYSKGQGSGEGVRVDGGDSDGNAVEFNGGATNSSGLKITGAGTGHGASILGGSGATGYGVNIAAQSTNGYGLYALGTGSGGGIKGAGGAEGNGIEAVGGGTSGDGLYAKAAGTGDGIAAHGGGVAGDGISATADNDGDGLQATGAGVGNTDFNPDISGSMDTLATYVDTEVASILAAVDTEVSTLITELAKVPKSDGAVSWNATALTAAATALLDLANAVETGISVRNALRLAILAGAGKLSGAGTDTEILLNPGGTKNRVTATVDGDGNRSAIVLDLT